MPDNVRDSLPFIFELALACGLAAYVVAPRAPRRIELALLVAGLGAIVALTQVRSDEGTPVANPIAPDGLWRAATWWAERPDVFPLLSAERALNVLAFVPVGFLTLRLVERWWVALIGVGAFSMFLECAQAATRARVADTVDVVLNTTGGAIGIVAAVALARASSSRVRG